jgi:8-oxo-dGTP pyrophosphatase MutT (NUDIX family)
MATEQEEEYRPVAGIAVIRDIQQQGTSENDDDMHCITRKPSEKLFLVVKKDRSDNSWGFPQGGMKTKKKNKETVAQAALRELSEECGQDIKVELIDTEAVCSYQYRYPAHFVQKKNRNFAGSNVSVIMHFFLFDY